MKGIIFVFNVFNVHIIILRMLFCPKICQNDEKEVSQIHRHKHYEAKVSLWGRARGIIRYEISQVIPCQHRQNRGQL